MIDLDQTTEHLSSARLCWRDYLNAKTNKERVEALDSIEHDLRFLASQVEEILETLYTDDGEIKEDE